MKSTRFCLRQCIDRAGIERDSMKFYEEAAREIQAAHDLQIEALFDTAARESRERGDGTTVWDLIREVLGV